MDTPIRVLLADDHPAVRVGVRAALEQAGLSVVGETAHGDEVCALAEALRPDVLILDLHMPGPPPAETVAALRARLPALRLLILSAFDTPAQARDLIALGVAGYLLKDEPLSAVVEATRLIAVGSTAFSSAILAKLLPTPADADDQVTLRLTPRERQLLRLLTRGWEVPQIAAALNVTEPTIRNYLSRLYPVLGVHSRAEATAWAHRHGLADG